VLLAKLEVGADIAELVVKLLPGVVLGLSDEDATEIVELSEALVA